MLKEYINTGHWSQRVNDRAVNIEEIVYPPAIFEGVENKEALKVALDERIKKIIRARILAYQVLQDPDSSKYVSTVIVSMQLRKGGQLYTPVFKVDGGDGNIYIGLTHNNTLLTLLVMPKEKVDPYSLTQRAIAHMKAQGINITEDDVVVKALDKNTALVDVDSVIQQLVAEKEAPMGVPKTPEDLPYKAKKDYLKSTPGRPNFVTHNQFGRGEIMSSEQGMGGKWNNISIKFPQGVKTFKTMYALGYFGK